MQQKYFIKGMVCERCIASVREVLEDMHLTGIEVTLGEVSFNADVQIKESIIEERLNALGFELLKDKRIQLVKDIKSLIDEVYSGNFEFPYNFRFFAFASEKLKFNHDAISEAFMSAEKSTLEKYIIDYRINKVKELLVYTDKTLADIAFALGFSSVAHLSKQFKDNAGLTPSHFRQIKLNKDTAQSVDGSLK